MATEVEVDQDGKDVLPRTTSYSPASDATVKWRLEDQCGNSYHFINTETA